MKFWCLSSKKKSNNVVMSQTSIVLVVLVNHHNEYNQAFWYHSIVSVSKETNKYQNPMELRHPMVFLDIWAWPAAIKAESSPCNIITLHWVRFKSSMPSRCRNLESVHKGDKSTSQISRISQYCIFLPVVIIRTNNTSRRTTLRGLLAWDVKLSHFVGKFGCVLYNLLAIWKTPTCGREALTACCATVKHRGGTWP